MPQGLQLIKRKPLKKKNTAGDLRAIRFNKDSRLIRSQHLPIHFHWLDKKNKGDRAR
jgi:hypothetical protein